MVLRRHCHARAEADAVREGKPVEVAVIGGGCASIAAAFELTRPQHRGKYHVTIYQIGWRLGGKGASGRGPADRIEEHGIHIWMGFYENAFRLLRECYAELNRDPRSCSLADWRDAFTPEPVMGVMDRSGRSEWVPWLSYFPPADGLPGDPLTEHNPFTVTNYMLRAVNLLRTLVGAAQRSNHAEGTRLKEYSYGPGRGPAPFVSPDEIAAQLRRVLTYGLLTTTGGLVEALSILQAMLAALGRYGIDQLSRLLEMIAAAARAQLGFLLDHDDEARRVWEIIDLTLAIMVGIARFGLLTDPRGFDAIDDYECLEWLRLNGAADRSLDSAIIHGLYDLPFGYEDGDYSRPRIAAGQAIRGALRMFFTYRGSLFWKLRAGMGDVLFAPFYEVLKKRGATFRFFHRLRNVKISKSESLAPGERPYVAALEFDVQAATVSGSDYEPLIEVHGIPCWPSQPDFRQLVDGQRLQRERRDFESHWDQRRAASRTLRVAQDFDCVVLGVGLGAIPYLCREIIERDQRWRDMVTHCKTVATQAFQIWMREDMASIASFPTQVTVSGFVQPFDSWADMRQVIDQESWTLMPRSVAYFCSALPDAQLPAHSKDQNYLSRCREVVRDNAIRFLNRDIAHLWPDAVTGAGFRWELLVDPLDPANPRGDESSFNTQFWTANVNPSDRYSASLPGTIRYRISPLDNTYDNLTVAGDWTSCGFNEGCVEAAIMSGRLAAHAISRSPRLEEIIGYDHP
jgi:uncharacterized protein with NAD-binding domain and iron-sulfur cluster